MSGAIIGIIVFIVMLFLVLIGVPVFISMMLTCIAGFWMIGGSTMVISQLTTAPFTVGASYTYAILPLFMIVGTLAGETGVAKGAFSAMDKWLGRTKGGLLYTLIAANAAFGACSGIGTAGQVVFSKMAAPEMEEKGYDRSLTLGTIAGSASLASLIPPSIPIVMYCLLTGLSVGKALMYGLSSGILLMIVMMLATKIYIKIFPNTIPERDGENKVPMIEKIKSLWLLFPIVMVFCVYYWRHI